MAKSKHAAWIGAAWAVMTGGCGTLVGLGDGYYLQEGAGGGRQEAAGGGIPEGTGGRMQEGTGGGTGPGEDCMGEACSTPPSCVGLDETCGPTGKESCCASMPVAGGGFYRDNSELYPASVSGFALDRFEVTVGRFRKFVEAYPESKPKPGAGRHPLFDRSGWDAGWDGSWLPVNAAELKEAVKCDQALQTWTDVPDAQENLPMNCLSWYLAFAFCAWDGGRLPTELEWNYAAAGGDQQRKYPWSADPDAPIDGSYAVYDCTDYESPAGECGYEGILPVGARPKGDGRWGQADLVGSMWEWSLDWYAAYPGSCVDCANLAPASGRVVRGGSFVNDASYLLTYERTNDDPADIENDTGVRCARDR
ncbi:formylglycine-generating enzyme family protein [Sorangium sp. So ce1335]|uniref:formylglycine-generating enzyme family protein n=1 Tax=Sorangium sp. So ce1335 TaxID=3133335 RepID=UPI003F5D8904